VLRTGSLGRARRIGTCGTTPCARFQRQTKEPSVVDQVFEITEESGRAGGAPVIKVKGEVDVATSPALRERLQDVHGPGIQIVDLHEVTFLDSTGLGVLVGALKRCRETGGSLRLVIGEPRILRIFEITGLTDVFSIFPSVDDAVEA
jgi:anti-sigma B factor antagonist